MVRRVLKFLSFSVLSLIVLGIVVILVLQTPYLKQIVLAKAVDAFNQQSNGRLQVGKLKGNLFSSVILEDVALQVDNTPLLRCERLLLQYELTGLMVKKINIRQAVIERPLLSLRRLPDSTWNAASLQFGSENAATDETEEPFTWRISVEEFAVESGSVRWQSGEVAGADGRVDDLQVRCGVWFKDEQMRLKLLALSFQGRQPDIDLRETTLDLASAPDEIKVDDFQLQTDASRLSAQGDLTGGDNPLLDLSFRAEPISLAEISRLLPMLNLHGFPEIEVTARGPLDALEVAINLQHTGGVANLRANLALEDEPVRYEIDGRFEDIDLYDWTRDSTLISDLNARLRIRGEGIERNTAAFRLTLEADSSRFAGLILAPSVITAQMRRDTVLLRVNANLQQAGADFAGRVTLGAEETGIQGELKVENAVLSNFIPGLPVSAEINGSVRFDGAISNSMQITGDAQVNLAGSTIQNVEVDTAIADLRFLGDDVALRQCQISMPVGKLDAQGFLSSASASSLELTAVVEDFRRLPAIAGLDTLEGSGDLTAEFNGRPDSVQVSADLQLFKLLAAGVAIDTLRADLNGHISSSQQALDLNTTIDSVDAYGIKLKKTVFSANLVDSLAHFEFEATNRPDLSVIVNGDLNLLPDTTRLFLQDLEVEYREHLWRNVSPSSYFNWSAGSLSVHDLVLLSDGQYVTLRGVFDTTGESDLNLVIADLNLANFSDLIGETFDWDGLVDIDVQLAGTMKTPKLNLDFKMSEPQYLDLSVQEISGKLGYADGYFDGEVNLRTSEGDSLLESSAKLPFNFALSPFESEFLTDEQLEFKLSTRGIDVSFLSIFDLPVRNLQGMLVGDIVVSNTWNDLRGVGPIRWLNGYFEIKQMGTKYTNGTLVLVLKEKQLIINELYLRSGGGFIRSKEGSISLSQDKLEEFNAEIRLQNFELINNKKIRARARGDITLGGSVQEPHFSGDLEIDDMTLDYARLMQNAYTEQLASQPFFIITETDSTTFDTTGALRFQKKDQGTEFTQSDFYRNLTGELTLHLLRNCWIKGDGLNLELRGDLSALKQGPDFRFFGTVSSARGFYSLFGNRFQIAQGSVTFKGEPEINPDLAVEATYTFRNKGPEDSELHEFVVKITGTMLAPKFNFLLDGSEARQEDVLSILLFGQSYDNLSLGARTDASGSDARIDKFATGVVTGQLLKELTGVLGEELKLDVVEIEGGEGLENASLRVGKYITPEVFVVVAQDFSEEGGNQTVEVEYEIPKKILFFNLLLHAQPSSVQVSPDSMSFGKLNGEVFAFCKGSIIVGKCRMTLKGKGTLSKFYFASRNNYLSTIPFPCADRF